MKRLLMATTALCLGAGTAAADIALSGSAEMGVAGSKDDSVRFHTDIDVTFTLSGATDAGVTFGSAIDLDEVQDDTVMKGTPKQLVDDATANDDDDGGIAVFMSQPQGFGTVTMGDTAGAIAWAVSDARGAGPGSIRDNHEHGGSSGNDGLDASHDNQILRWDRAIGSGFSMAASVELSDDADGKPGGKTYDPILGVGGTYSMGMGVGTLGLGAGFQMGSWDHTMSGGLPGTQRAAIAVAMVRGPARSTLAPH
ncbi:MAG: porin [Rhodobacter sp.]|nr:porin [Rhodobacter sp.]